jgi:hypothetical protein
MDATNNVIELGFNSYNKEGHMHLMYVDNKIREIYFCPKSFLDLSYDSQDLYLTHNSIYYFKYKRLFESFETFPYHLFNPPESHDKFEDYVNNVLRSYLNDEYNISCYFNELYNLIYFKFDE